MLYRLSGKTSDGRTFTLKADAANIFDASAAAKTQLAAANVKPENVTQLIIKPLVAASAGVRFGKPSAKKKTAK